MMKNDNFRYSVHDEPTDDWTIEELLKWCLLQSQLKTTTKRDEIINTFQELFDVGKQEILELQSQVIKIQKEQREKEEQQHQHDDVDVNEEVEEQPITIGKQQQQQQQREEDDNVTSNNENENPNGKSANNNKLSNSKSKSNSKSNKTKNPTKIQIQIIQGPYKGITHTLQPTYKKPCWIGRSTSKKFRDRGISLNKDDEVSTTHGKFHVTNSSTSSSSSARATKVKFMFTDTGSTNGTLYNGEEIEDNIPLELEDDMVIVIGNSHFLIHLI